MRCESRLYRRVLSHEKQDKTGNLLLSGTVHLLFLIYQGYFIQGGPLLFHFSGTWVGSIKIVHGPLEVK